MSIDHYSFARKHFAEKATSAAGYLQAIKHYQDNQANTAARVADPGTSPEDARYYKREIDPPDRQANYVLNLALDGLEKFPSSRELASIAVDRANQLNSASDLIRLGEMPELPVELRAAAFNAAIHAPASTRHSHNGKVSDWAYIGERIGQLPGFESVRDNLVTTFNAYAAKHPDAARLATTSINIPRGAYPQPPDWLRVRFEEQPQEAAWNKRDRERQTDNLRNGILEFGAASGVRSSSAGFLTTNPAEFEQLQAYERSVRDYERSARAPLSQDNVIGQRATAMLQEHAARQAEAAHQEELRIPERYQAALQRYATTQGAERLAAAVEVVALHDSVPLEIQQPKEAWIAADTFVKSVEAKQAKAHEKNPHRPVIKIGGYDVYRLVPIAASQIQQYETQAIARAKQEREEAARYKEGLTRMVGGAPYDRGQDLRASAAILELDEKVGPQSGFHASDRNRAVSRASQVLAYAMPQELTELGLPRAQAEAVIAQAKTRQAQETAQRDAERARVEAAQRQQQEARPVPPSVATEPAQAHPTASPHPATGKSGAINGQEQAGSFGRLGEIRLGADKMAAKPVPDAAPATPPRASAETAAPAAPKAGWQENPKILESARKAYGADVVVGLRKRPGETGLQMRGVMEPDQIRQLMHLPPSVAINERNFWHNKDGTTTVILNDTDVRAGMANLRAAAEKPTPQILDLKSLDNGNIAIQFKGDIQLEAAAAALGVKPDEIIKMWPGENSAVTLSRDSFWAGQEHIAANRNLVDHGQHQQAQFNGGNDPARLAALKRQQEQQRAEQAQRQVERNANSARAPDASPAEPARPTGQAAAPSAAPPVESLPKATSEQPARLNPATVHSGMNSAVEVTHGVSGHVGNAALALNVADGLAKGDIKGAAQAVGETVVVGAGQKAAGMAVARIAGAEAVPVVGQVIGAGFAAADAVDAAKQGNYGRATYSGVEATLYGVAGTATVAAAADCWNPTVVAPAAVAVVAGGAAVTMTAARTAWDSRHIVAEGVSHGYQKVKGWLGYGPKESEQPAADARVAQTSSPPATVTENKDQAERPDADASMAGYKAQRPRANLRAIATGSAEQPATDKTKPLITQSADARAEAPPAKDPQQISPQRRQVQGMALG